VKVESYESQIIALVAIIRALAVLIHRFVDGVLHGEARLAVRGEGIGLQSWVRTGSIALAGL
jgi:hypothetical protein